MLIRLALALSLVSLAGCAHRSTLSPVPCAPSVVVDVQIDYGPDCSWDLCAAPESRAVCDRGVLVYEHTVPALHRTWQRAGEVQATRRSLREWDKAMREGTGVVVKAEGSAK